MASIGTTPLAGHKLLPQLQSKKMTTINGEIPSLAVAQQYIHIGLAFSDVSKSLSDPPATVLDRLESSLSLALLSFHTEEEEEGVGLVHATARCLDVGSVLSPFADHRLIAHGFFPINNRGGVIDGGQNLPLFAAQLTELADGLFLGCSFNLSIGNRASFAQFLNNWAEISRAKASAIPRCPPAISRWYDNEKEIVLPHFRHSSARQNLSQRMFHFSLDSIDHLTERAKHECNYIEPISPFEALSALVWRCIARARRTTALQKITCWNADDCAGKTAATAEEILGTSGLGRAARLLHVRYRTHRSNRSRMYTKHDIMIKGSPEFDFYGCDFGFGTPAGLRSCEANWFDGSVMFWPGPERDGSVELEMCLSPEAMSVLESDPEFTEYLSLPVPLPLPLRLFRLPEPSLF